MAAKRRKGGPPTYTEATAAKRKAGDIRLRLTPEQADKLRTLATGHPGGMSGLVARWIETARQTSP